jgi:hypothetical protein
MTNANDRLELPTEAPLLDRSCWKARPSLPAELDPVLDKVKTLARGGLISMMVLDDFLRHHIAPLQQRSRMVQQDRAWGQLRSVRCGAGGPDSGDDRRGVRPRVAGAPEGDQGPLRGLGDADGGPSIACHTRSIRT